MSRIQPPLSKGGGKTVGFDGGILTLVKSEE